MAPSTDNVKAKAADVADGAQNVGKAAVSGAQDIGKAAASGAQDVAVEIGSAVGSGAKVAFAAVSNVLKPASDAVVPSLAAAGAAVKGLFSVVKLEIFRDFWQIISLFFVGLGDRFPGSFKAVFGNVSEVFSVCFSCWWDDYSNRNAYNFALAWFGISALVGMVFTAFFGWRYRKYDPRAQEQGLEVTTWAQRTKSEHRTVKIICLVLTTLFLPVFRNIVQVFSCHEKYLAVGDVCFKGTHGFLVFAGFVIMFFYIVPCPILFWKVIKSNKPQPTLFDAEGKERTGGYTDDDYRMDLAAIHNPYKYLFEDYERDWAQYKVLVMLIKIALVAPLCVFTYDNTVGPEIGTVNKVLLAQSIITSIILAVYCVLAWSSRPFLDDSDDLLDGITRATTFVTACCGIVVSQTTSGQTVFGIVLNILAGFTVLASITLFVATNKKVKRKIQAWRQRIALTSSRNDPKIPLIFSAKELRFDRERKLRIWHEFWDVLFAQEERFRLPWNKQANAKKYEPVRLGFQYGNSPPYLQGFQGTIAERHQENKEIAQKEGFSSFEAALFYAAKVNNDEQYRNFGEHMQFLVRGLQGIDVFWSGSVESVSSNAGVQQRATKPSSSVTKFGKMYVVPFPFTAVIMFDDSDDSCVFSANPLVAGVRRDTGAGMAELFKLVAENRSPEVQRRKEVRLMLRALDRQMVFHFHQEWHNKTKQRQVRKKGSNGNMRTVTENYTVRVLFTFRNGHFCVDSAGRKAVWIHPQTKQKVDVTKGFQCSVKYNDGVGVDREGKTWTNEPAHIGHGPLGITPDFSTNPNGPSRDLIRLFNNNWWPAQKQAQNQTRKEQIIATFDVYRQWMMHEFQSKERTLSYAFWYYVFNNDTISREDLDTVLSQHEINPLIRGVLNDYKNEIDGCYTKLDFFNKDNANAYWYIFWHDVWHNNKHLAKVMANEAQLNPIGDQALCYKPMKRQALVAKLKDMGLHAAPGCCGFKTGFVNEQLIDQLYNKVASFGARREHHEVAFKLTKDDDEQLPGMSVTDKYACAADYFQTSHGYSQEPWTCVMADPGVNVADPTAPQ